MSLVYLLDGYNIIHRIPLLAEKDLEDSRDHLIRMIEVHRPQGSFNNSVTIVFDSQSGGGAVEVSSSVKVVFSSGESADDYIKKAVARSPAKKRIVVVTDDKEIQFFVKPLGARVVGVDEFLSRMTDFSGKKRSVHKPGSDPQEAKHLSKTLEHQITSELEKIWLGKKAG